MSANIQDANLLEEFVVRVEHFDFLSELSTIIPDSLRQHESFVELRPFECHGFNAHFVLLKSSPITRGECPSAILRERAAGGLGVILRYIFSKRELHQVRARAATSIRQYLQVFQ